MIPVTLRPQEEADLDVLAPWLVHPSIARWWGRPRDEHDRRADLRSADDARAFTILAGGEIAGWLQTTEELEPDYRHGGLDIMLGEGFQGRGIGRRALALGARELFTERGHHRITIDPAAANEWAIRCYASIGFRPVGIMRRYERGPDGRWEDGLLMDLLADELIFEFS
jgi:aminoglycoside 6'-N-acetyltransferase